LLQERLLCWYPSDNRGQILRTEKNWIYSDCYNANPDSMRDSLKAFESIFTDTLPRLYVLGSMYELGDDAESFHREITARLRIKECDRVICVGSYADQYHSGLKYAGVSDEKVYCCQNADMAADRVEAFEGAVFLKGSRLNRLETLIPANARKTVLESGKLC
jgi:UDP-N-acetylmuramoyl-tripeptide--D-alanyl-D-alanine ligase